MKNSRFFWTKTLCLLAVGATLTAARAEPAGTPDQALELAARQALHQKAIDMGIRVQVNDGVVYLYGRTVNRPHRIDVENVVRDAVPGHRVVSSIEDGPAP